VFHLLQLFSPEFRWELSPFLRHWGLPFDSLCPLTRCLLFGIHSTRYCSLTLPARSSTGYRNPPVRSKCACDPPSDIELEEFRSVFSHRHTEGELLTEDRLGLGRGEEALATRKGLAEFRRPIPNTTKYHLRYRPLFRNARRRSDISLLRLSRSVSQSVPYIDPTRCRTTGEHSLADAVNELRSQRPSRTQSQQSFEATGSGPAITIPGVSNLGNSLDVAGDP
jgi:hypothetical protein